MADTVRLQIEIDRERMEEIEELLRLGGLKTKRDLFNNALTLLKWASREKARGNSICSADANGKIQKELELPFLETVASTIYRAAATAAVKLKKDTNPESDSEPDSRAAVGGLGSLRIMGRT